MDGKHVWIPVYLTKKLQIHRSQCGKLARVTEKKHFEWCGERIITRQYDWDDHFLQLLSTELSTYQECDGLLKRSGTA